MSHLCNRCVREFLILARTWFAFGLPSKTGCDTARALDRARRRWGNKPCKQSRMSKGSQKSDHKGNTYPPKGVEVLDHRCPSNQDRIPETIKHALNGF
jgi:hypothetical protein